MLQNVFRGKPRITNQAKEVWRPTHHFVVATIHKRHRMDRFSGMLVAVAVAPLFQQPVHPFRYLVISNHTAGGHEDGRIRTDAVKVENAYVLQ